MKILFLTQWFQPEPFFKGLPFARALRDRGHSVQVLTGFPNYPGGKLYPGYRVRLWQKEVMDGIPVCRVPLYPSHDQSGPRRIANYLSFAISAAGIGPFLIHKPDVVYVYNLVTLALPSFLLKLLWKCPAVYDIQDLWPESVADSGMMKSSVLQRLLAKGCDRIYHEASHLVTLSPGMKSRLVERGIPDERISVIYNWSEQEWMYPLPDKGSGTARSDGLEGFVVMFAGTMGVMQGLDTVLDAAQILKTSEPRIRFVLVGGGVDRERLKSRASQLNVDNVVFMERQAPENMGPVLALADVLLVHLKDIPLFRITIPSKLQSYLSVGKPVLVAVRGDAADIVRASDAGIVVDPENPESMAEGVLKLYRCSQTEREQMGRNGREHYLQHMSQQYGVKRFEGIFQSAIRE